MKLKRKWKGILGLHFSSFCDTLAFCNYISAYIFHDFYVRTDEIYEFLGNCLICAMFLKERESRVILELLMNIKKWTLWWDYFTQNASL